MSRWNVFWVNEKVPYGSRFCISRSSFGWLGNWFSFSMAISRRIRVKVCLVCGMIRFLFCVELVCNATIRNIDVHLSYHFYDSKTTVADCICIVSNEVQGVPETWSEMIIVRFLLSCTSGKLEKTF